MLLKHLYDFAVSRNLLEDPAFRRNTPVRWIIHLDSSGNLIGQGPQETVGSRKNKGREYDVPKTSRPTGGGQVADFLVDDIGAIFGLNGKLDEALKPRAITNLKGKHDDYWQQIRTAKQSTGDLRFDALITFHAALGGSAPSFLRHNTKGTGWLVFTGSGQEVVLGNDMLTFSVGTGDPLFLDEKIRDYWRSVHAREIESTEASSEIGTCLITGKTVTPLARTHTPMVTGLPKTHKNDTITQRGFVGFESDSFRSYGFEKSYNAPTSISASRGYLLALQYLSKSQNHWLSTGPAWLCFWAVESKDATNIFARLLKQPDPMTVRKFFASPWVGLEKQPPASDKLIAVTLTAAGPRIVVKSWVQMPLTTAAENFKAWFTDLQIDTGRIETSPEPNTDENTFPPLAIKRLAGCTAPLTKKGNFLIPDEEKQRPEVIAQLYRAALEGTAPSITLLNPILQQLHSRLVRDDNYDTLYDESRFALLKLILNRQTNRTMEIKPSLTADTDDAAYNCGRLLAILAASQAKAHEFKLEGAGIADRYFGTASVSPASVFPLLIRLNRHHLGKISKSERYRGHEKFLTEQIESVLSLFKPSAPGKPPVFPRTLDLQAQGRFALGFYQQKAADEAARRDAKNNPNNSTSENK